MPRRDVWSPGWKGPSGHDISGFSKSLWMRSHPRHRFVKKSCYSVGLSGWVLETPMGTSFTPQPVPAATRQSPGVWVPRTPRCLKTPRRCFCRPAAAGREWPRVPHGSKAGNSPQLFSATVSLDFPSLESGAVSRAGGSQAGAGAWEGAELSRAGFSPGSIQRDRLRSSFFVKRAKTCAFIIGTEFLP